MRKISFKEFSTIRNYTATLGHKVSTHYYQKKKCQKTHIAKLSNLKVACSKKIKNKNKNTLMDLFKINHSKKNNAEFSPYKHPR